MVLFTGTLILGYGSALSARAHLLDGKRQLEKGRTRVFAGRVSHGIEELNMARASFIQASASARNPFLRMVGWLPILGRTPDAIAALAEGAELAGAASVEVAEAINGLPRGLSSLTPRLGRIPVESLHRLAPGISRASLLVHAAHQKLQGTTTGWVSGSVADAELRGLAQLSSLDKSLASAAVLLNRLPRFLGATRPMKYFFGAQSPAELRGTGGIIGAYSILTIHRGELRFSRFRPIEELPNFNPKRLKAPTPEYARNYDQFGGAGFWPNINMTPDFPSAAQAMLSLFERGTGAALNGVLLADPFALKSLLQVTGPVTVRRYRVTVDANNVVSYTANQAYASFKHQPTRKVVLGEVAKAVLDEFMRGSGSPGRSLRALTETVANGHLLLYSTDPAMERALVEAGEAGSLSGAPGEFLSVVQNNGSATKLDFYLDRGVTYAVKLGPEGTAVGQARVQLTNNAPSHGLSPIIIGPFKHVAQAGENVAFMSLYCGSSCELRGFLRNNQSRLVVAGRERGHRFYQDYLSIPSHKQADLRFDLANPGAWEGDHTGGVYRLTFRNQPTIKPTKLRIHIRAPEGMNVYFTNLPMKVSGDTAEWEGIPGSRVELEVRFQLPFLNRVWRSVTDFLSKPVF